MSTPSSRVSPLSRHRLLAPAASVRVSPLCLGSMTFGDRQQERYGEITKDQAMAIMDHFYAEGGNFIDTANAYQNGQSEEWIGEWMANRGTREEMVIATKYSAQYRGADKSAIKSNSFGNGIKSMKASLTGSLKRLNTDYVDLFYVHWWDAATSIPEIMHGLNDLVVAGKVHYLGISDTPAWIVSKANEYARQKGLRPFVVYQGMWNAALRDFERDIIPMARDEGMALCPYGVLNQGRFQTAAGFQEREKHNPGRNFIPTSSRDKQVSAVLEKIAERKGCSLLNVALAYCMQKTPYVFPIIGQRKVEHLQGSIEGLKINLEEDDVAEVETAYEFDHGFPHSFLGGSLFDSSKPSQIQGPKDVWLAGVIGSGTFDYVEAPKAIRQHHQ